jgi:hypothetical protein
MDPMTTDAFIVTAQITYRPFRIPPRCRTERQVDEVFTDWIQVPSATSTEAPVVALVPNDLGHLGSPGGNIAELRSWNGQLYTVETETPDCTSPATLAGSDLFPAEIDRRYLTPDLRHAVESVRTDLSQFLIVDGVVWRKTAEPVYAVHSLGRGTYLDIEVGSVHGNMSRRFALTDREAAIAAAVAIARNSRDEESVEQIIKTAAPTILDASAFKVPSAAARVAAAGNEVRMIADLIRERLAGDHTHESLTEIKELVDAARSLLSKNDIDLVPATGPTSDKATK